MTGQCKHHSYSTINFPYQILKVLILLRRSQERLFLVPIYTRYINGCINFLEEEMSVIYIYPTRYICRLDPVSGKYVLNEYTPISFN